MKILISGKMQHGTLQAKLIPLSKNINVDSIYFVRKDEGPKIDKVNYIVLPKIFKLPLINLVLTPIVLIFLTFKLKIDLILSYHLVPHGFFAYLTSILTAKKFIFAQTGGQSEKLSEKQIYNYLIRKIFNKASFVIVPGSQSKAFWEKKFGKQNDILILHSTINIKKFTPSEQKADLDFIYVGALRARKQVNLIINSFSKLAKIHKSAKLGIIGDGILKTELKNQAKNLNIDNNVIFFGYNTEIISYLNRSKIFVMASKMEGLPVALMEAMSSGKIVIAPNVNNIASVLNDNTGFLLPKDFDEKNLYDFMIYSYNNFEKCQHLSRNARKIIVDKYSYKYAIKTWNYIFNKLNLK